jgi:hypothetical protein
MTGARPQAGASLESIGRFEVEVGEVRSLGSMAAGERRVVAITGGCARGLLEGEILTGGADWQWLRSDGVTEICAQYVLRTKLGELVEIRSDGYRHGPPEIMARLAAGESVDPSLYYFRTSIRFATAAPRPELASLNGLLGIGIGERRARQVLLETFVLR